VIVFHTHTVTAAPAPVVLVTTGSLAFGTQPIGVTTLARALTLRNVGTAMLNIASITASDDFA
jgi:hypothetical protein